NQQVHVIRNTVLANQDAAALSDFLSLNAQQIRPQLGDQQGLPIMGRPDEMIIQLMKHMRHERDSIRARAEARTEPLKRQQHGNTPLLRPSPEGLGYRKNHENNLPLREWLSWRQPLTPQGELALHLGRSR